MSALGEITAGLLAIGAKIMRTFVTVEVDQSGDCTIGNYTATFTQCGDQLIDGLSKLVYSGVQLLSDLMGAAMVNIPAS